jgi:hypothetical protein
LTGLGTVADATALTPSAVAPAPALLALLDHLAGA